MRQYTVSRSTVQLGSKQLTAVPGYTCGTLQHMCCCVWLLKAQSGLESTSRDIGGESQVERVAERGREKEQAAAAKPTLAKLATIRCWLPFCAVWVSCTVHTSTRLIRQTSAVSCRVRCSRGRTIVVLPSMLGRLHSMLPSPFGPQPLMSSTAVHAWQQHGTLRTSTPACSAACL